MPKKSAGILVYRFIRSGPEVFLAHPGGPFYTHKDEGSWTIPKGEFDDNENPLDAAKREFKEETGVEPEGEFIELKPFKLKSGKQVFCFACEGDIDPSKIKSNHFEMEWPPKSGVNHSFPEIDKGQWFDTATARLKMISSQVPLIDELLSMIANEKS